MMLIGKFLRYMPFRTKKSFLTDVDFLSKELNSNMINNLTNHRNNSINNIIHSENYYELLAYKEFNLDKIDSNLVFEFMLKNNNQKIMNHFIDHTSNLNYQYPDGSTFIHLACLLSKTETIIYAINRGVNLECTNHFKIKPIHLVSRFATKEILELMDSKGVDIRSKDLNGKTPYLYASECPEKSAYLKDRNAHNDTDQINFVSDNFKSRHDYLLDYDYQFDKK